MTITMSVFKTTFADETTAEISGAMRNQPLIAALQVDKTLSIDAEMFFPEVKLVGGSGPHEGNIFVGGEPVCDDYHGSSNALVVCRFRQLHVY